MLGGVKADPNTWRAVHFRFSKLHESHKNDYQTKIAINTVRDFVKEGDGAIFCMTDRDILVICKGVSKNQIDKMVFRLRYLFADDALSYIEGGQENPDFSTMFDLAVDWEKVDAIAKAKLEQVHKPANPGMKVSQEELTAKPLTPTRLVNLEKDISAADLTKVMRRQPVCAVLPSKPVRRVFDEFYINIAHLRRLIMANVDFTSNRWLFTYLTQMLDVKMLSMLSKQGSDYFDQPISLNLNVETLLSDSFAAFNASVKPSIKVSIVIEIHVADVFADMPSFLLAKEAVQKMGYRVCLDGLTEQSFPQVSREKLGFDLAKLQWSPKMLKGATSPEMKEIARAIEACSPNRMILCRCDGKDALSFGQQFGISLFQGRHLDLILNPDSKVVN